jgi:hypothetical protein
MGKRNFPFHLLAGFSCCLFRRIESFERRRVLHAGFAAVQDDICGTCKYRVASLSAKGAYSLYRSQLIWVSQEDIL